ncbi:uncharacterized protein LOC126410377 [Nymphaea colorata]|nr:uncharacterized protein LOC126410377 [Nymphaea colorata]
MATTLQHVCHVHPMGMPDSDGKGRSCGACGRPILSENLYGCRSCAFFLHRFCALQYPSSLEGHPAHQQHPLHLLSAPAHPSGAFRCDICGDSGSSGFIYHCQSCNFDAHFLCLHMPRTARSRGRQHPLRLLFRPPTQGSICCDACRLQIHHCCYKCSKNCDFALHRGCLEKHEQPATKSKKKWTKEKMLWEVTKRVARKVSVHLLLDAFGGWGEVVDVLFFGPEDLAFLCDCFDNLPVDTIFPGGNGDFSGLDVVTVDDLPDCIDEADDSLLRKAVKLLRKYMASSSATKPPSTSSSNIGTITKEHALE